MEPESPEVFVRDASGLVKAAGGLDVFIYNIGLISVGIGLAFTHSFAAAFYPSGSIAWASAIAVLLMLPVGLAMWYWSSSLPRSGGVYVYVSRTFGPSIGFAASFVECVSWLFYAAVAADAINSMALAPAFEALQTPQVNFLFETSGGKFLIATVILWLCFALLYSGMRRYFTVQKIMFTLACVGTLSLLYVLVTTSAPEFREAYNAFASRAGYLNYRETIEVAKQSGFRKTSATLFGSLKTAVWPFLPLIGGAFSIAIGGEVRRAVRNQRVGIFGSILLAGILFILFGFQSYDVFGREFQGAVNFLAAQGHPDVSSHTNIVLLSLIGTKSALLCWLITAGFIAWMYFWIPGVLSYVSRAVLAWSFDRVAPEMFAHVNEKFHTPTYALLFTAIVAQVFLVLYLFTEFFATLVFILGAALAWLIALAAGVAYPRLCPSLFQQSPHAGKRMLGVPMMTLASTGGLVGLGTIVVLLWNDSVAAGHDLPSVITISGLFVVAVVCYQIVRVYRKRKGIAIERAFDEIPIE